MRTICQTTKMQFAFEYHFKIVPETRNILLELFHASNNPVDKSKTEERKKKIIDELVENYISTPNPGNAVYEKAIFHLATKADVKSSLKNYLLSKSLPSNSPNNFIRSVLIDEVLQVLIKIDQDNSLNVDQCLLLLDLIDSFVFRLEKDKSYNFIVETVFELYKRMLQAVVHLFKEEANFVPSESKKLAQMLNETIRQVRQVFKANNGELITNYSLDFVELLFQILKCNKVKYEARVEAALALMFALDRLPVEQTEFIENKHFPALDLIENMNQAVSLNLKSTKLENCFGNEIILYNAIARARKPAFQFRDESFAMHLCRNLIYFSYCSQIVPHELSLISKTLLLVSESLTAVSDEEFEQNVAFLLQFCWVHLKHFVDVVRHRTEGFLGNIVKHSYRKKSEGRLLDSLTIYTFSDSVQEDVRLLAFEIFCKYLDNDAVKEELFNKLPQYLVGVMKKQTYTTEACNVLLSLIQKLKNHLTEEQFRKCILPVTEIIKSDGGASHIYDKIIIESLEACPCLFRILFPAKRFIFHFEYRLLLKCLLFARAKELKFGLEEGENWRKYWRNYIPFRKLDLLLLDNDDQTRVNILKLIVETPKTTEEFNGWELQTLGAFIIKNGAFQSITSSSLVVYLFKKLLIRFNCTHDIIKKRIEVNGEKSSQSPNPSLKRIIKEATALLKDYDNFIVTLINNLLLSVGPYANLVRRRMGLEILLLVHDAVSMELWLKCFQEDDVYNLRNILFESCERSRAGAVALLKTLPLRKLQLLDVNLTPCSHQYYNLCIGVACATKPLRCLCAPSMFEVCLHGQFSLPLSNGSDRRLKLLNLLLNKIRCLFKTTKSNILLAAMKFPLHGLISSVKCLIASRTKSAETNAEYASLFGQIVDLSLDMKGHIFKFVCDLRVAKTDLLEVTDMTSVDQLILVYAWRIVTEKMHLLTEIVKQTIESEHQVLLISIEQLVKVGQYFVEILTKSVHKGVSEQTYIGFSTVCQMFKKSKYPAINHLPLDWLRVIDYIVQGNPYDLSNSVRRVGFQFFVMAVFSTQQPSERETFKKTMKQIFASALNEEESRFILRLHSLNVLKGFFNSPKAPSYLNLNTAMYVVFKGLQSSVWTIRNCSSSLFSVLMTKMFGVQRSPDPENISPKNCLTIVEFESRHPNLLEFLLNRLSEECRKNDSLTLFYILLILARLRPSYSEDSEEVVTQFLPVLNFCLAHCDCRTREMAAKTKASFLPVQLLPDYLSEIFTDLSGNCIVDSKCHRLLLQIAHSFKIKPICGFLRNCAGILENPTKFSHKTIVLNMQVVIMALEKCIDLDLLKKLVWLVSKLEINDNEIVTARMKFKWYRFYIITFILLNKFAHSVLTFTSVVNETEKFLGQVDIETKLVCLKFLVYLNQTFTKRTYNEHALVYYGEVEIPDFVRSLVDSFDLPTTKQLLEAFHKTVVQFLKHTCNTVGLFYNRDYVTLFYVLMGYYPCVMRLFCGDLQCQLNILVNGCRCNNGEIISAILGCINAILLNSSEELFGNSNLKLDKLVELLMFSASPAAEVYRRLTVAQFLATCPNIFFTKTFLKDDQNVQNILNTAIILLEDEEPLVRNTLASFKTIKINDVRGYQFLWNITADQAKSELMSSVFRLLNRDVAINFMVSWSARYLPPYGTDTSDVRGEWNQYADNVSLQLAIMKPFKSQMWMRQSNWTKCEFARVVTDEILAALLEMHYSSPMVLKVTKNALTTALVSIDKFLKTYKDGDENLKQNLAIHFVNVLPKFLADAGFNEHASLKAFLMRLYSDYLNKDIIASVFHCV